MTQWFQFDPDRAPDSQFEPGRLTHLCAGNEGRLLDYRRTPVRIEKLCHETGLATIQVLEFEDKGALWELPYEDVGKYQFRQGSRKAPPAVVKQVEQAIPRFDRDVDVPCAASRREETLQVVHRECERAVEWLAANSRFFGCGRALPEGEPEGSELLWGDTRTYMEERGLADIESFFARRYVSNPFQEAVKAHRIAVAQLGLAPYRGKMLRDPSQLDGPRIIERRMAHVTARMGLTQAIFGQANREEIILYRMESCEGPLRPRNVGTALVSASFRMDIVHEMSGWADPGRTVAIYRRAVPLRRVLMTYLETEAMNHPFREAEAVLLADPDNQAF